MSYLPYVREQETACISGVCHGPPGPLVPQSRFTTQRGLLAAGCTSCGHDGLSGIAGIPTGLALIGLGVAAFFLLPKIGIGFGPASK